MSTKRAGRSIPKPLFMILIVANVESEKTQREFEKRVCKMLRLVALMAGEEYNIKVKVRPPLDIAVHIVNFFCRAIDGDDCEIRVVKDGGKEAYYSECLMIISTILGFNTDSTGVDFRKLDFNAIKFGEL